MQIRVSFYVNGEIKKRNEKDPGGVDRTGKTASLKKAGAKPVVKKLTELKNITHG